MPRFASRSMWGVLATPCPNAPRSALRSSTAMKSTLVRAAGAAAAAIATLKKMTADRAIMERGVAADVRRLDDDRNGQPRYLGCYIVFGGWSGSFASERPAHTHVHAHAVVADLLRPVEVLSLHAHHRLIQRV